MSDRERFEPERIVETLNHAGVRYVIVGGLPAGAHGVVRATRDLDIVPDAEPANMEALARALAGLGGRHPVEERLTAANLSRPISIKLQTVRGEVHVLNRMPATPAFRELEAARILVEIDQGVEAPCALSVICAQ